MDTNLFSQINTTISVKEASLITADQFQKLLQAGDKENLSLLLQATPYHLSAEDLDDLNIIDDLLMKELASEYKWAFEESPDKAIPTMFSLRYVYHNIKVFLKARATKQDLSQLLIPIGEQSLEALEHLISALSSEFFPEFMAQELQSIWAEYEDYHDVRVLEIGADLAYFKHLKKIAADLDNPAFTQAIMLMIDFYNIITVKRAFAQDKPNSFMLQLLSDEGSLTANDFINMGENGELMTWFNQINPDHFTLALLDFEEKMQQGAVTAVDLEYLYDLMQFQLLEEARYQSDGPLVLARYLLGREFEVKNLRLLLSAFSNELPLDAVKERMRPIYGQ